MDTSSTPSVNSFSIEAVNGFSVKSPLAYNSNSSLNSPQPQNSASSPFLSRFSANDSEFGAYDPKFGSINLKISDEDLADHEELIDNAFKEIKTNTKSHLISIKKRLIDEKHHALQEAEQIYLNKQSLLQDEIAALQSEIQSFKALKEVTAERRDVVMENVAEILYRNERRCKSPHSLTTLFFKWKCSVQTAKYLRQIEKTVSYFTRKNCLYRAMCTMRSNYQIRKSAKLQEEARFKFSKVTNEMVATYESELARMREDLTEAYHTAQQETFKRQQLEEDLRRMFLKNMTHMNMEALSLFHSTYNEHGPPPPSEEGDDRRLYDQYQRYLESEQLPSPVPRPGPAQARPPFQQQGQQLSQQQHQQQSQQQRLVQATPQPPAQSTSFDTSMYSQISQITATPDSLLPSSHVITERVEQSSSVSYSSNTLALEASFQLQQPALDQIRKLKDDRLALMAEQQQWQKSRGQGDRREQSEHEPLPRLPLQRPVHPNSGAATTESASSQQLQEAYQSSLSTTNKLAHNIPEPVRSVYSNSSSHSTPQQPVRQQQRAAPGSNGSVSSVQSGSVRTTPVRSSVTKQQQPTGRR